MLYTQSPFLIVRFMGGQPFRSPRPEEGQVIQIIIIAMTQEIMCKTSSIQHIHIYSAVRTQLAIPPTIHPHYLAIRPQSLVVIFYFLYKSNPFEQFCIYINVLCEFKENFPIPFLTAFLYGCLACSGRARYCTCIDLLYRKRIERRTAAAHSISRKIGKAMREMIRLEDDVKEAAVNVTA